MLIFDAVMDSAKTEKDLGTYWAPEDRSWLWYNDTIETHAFALRAMTELKAKDKRRSGLVRWLFLNKKLSHWKSTKATAEVLYSVAYYLKKEKLFGLKEEIQVTTGPVKMKFVFRPDRYTGKSNQLIIDEVQPSKMYKTIVEKKSRGLAFASATWHFSTEKLPEKAQGDLFQVNRKYFQRVSKGRETVLKPLAEGAKLRVGDEVEVHLSVRAKHAAEYVHLRDPRPAGMEPGAVTSGWRWDLGLSRYEETRDSGTNFFFEYLPVGQYTLKYRLRVNMAGHFRAAPTFLQSMYAPEFTAYSRGHRFQIAQ